MATLQSIRVKNLRSLEDTGFIDIKPITILVGKNSAGKSTFARLLPLLRQTAEFQKREPILWWGRLVDFGSFKESVNRSAQSKEIEISFRISGPDGLINSLNIHRFDDEESRTIEATIILAENVENRECHLKSIVIDVDDIDHIEINLTEKSEVRNIEINEMVWTPRKHQRQIISYTSIIPEIEHFIETSFRSTESARPMIRLMREDPFRASLHSYIASNMVHGNTLDESIRDIINSLDDSRPQKLLSRIKNIPNAPQSWISKVNKLDADSKVFRELRNWLVATEIRQLLFIVNNAIASTVSNCSYIEPLRATAERFYRKQSLAVSEVDSKGANVPFFLDSLSATERNHFEDWMQEHLQTSVRATSDGGHLSILIKDPTGMESNLADVGFGFSQLLPVALQLWAPKRTRAIKLRKRIESDPVLVIEQPELHLHPEYQAKIADLLVSAAFGTGTRLIVETHSPSIINRLGYLITMTPKLRDSIQILRFDRDEKAGQTTIKKSEFDGNGVLTNWPYGFFDA